MRHDGPQWRKPSVPAECILRAIPERWAGARHLTSLAGGLCSQALGFEHDGRDYVIRIGNSTRGYEKDRFVGMRFGAASLPVPEVCEIGYLPDGHAFCISRRAEGVRLSDLEEEGVVRVTRHVLDVVEAISRSDLSGTTGFGRFDSDGTAPFSSWSAFVTSILDPRHDWDQVGRTVGGEMIRDMCQLVGGLATHCPERRNLVHGDLGSFNLLSDGERIRGVIDWDLALFGDPLYDRANLLFWNEERLAPVIGGLSTVDVHGIDERVLCYQLRIGLSEIHANVTDARPTFDLRWLLRRCRTLLDSSGWTAP